MLNPTDLGRIPSPLLRARLAAYVVDIGRPDADACADVLAGAVAELVAEGASVTDVAELTGIAERRLRRLLTRPLAA
jgi:hypothetical protein